MTEISNEERYYLQMGLFTGSILTYFLSGYAPLQLWIGAWAIIFIFAIYNAMR